MSTEREKIGTREVALMLQRYALFIEAEGARTYAIRELDGSVSFIRSEVLEEEAKRAREFALILYDLKTTI